MWWWLRVWKQPNDETPRSLLVGPARRHSTNPHRFVSTHLLHSGHFNTWKIHCDTTDARYLLTGICAPRFAKPARHGVIPQAPHTALVVDPVHTKDKDDISTNQSLEKLRIFVLQTKMHSSDEDDELRQAIALSLGEEYQPMSGSPSTGRRPSSQVGKTSAIPRKDPVIVDLCEDTDASDNELTDVLPAKQTRLPVPLPISTDLDGRDKIQEKEQSPFLGSEKTSHGSFKNAGSSSKSLFQTLDRKQMEEERLARRKRKASVSPPGLRRKKLAFRDSDVQFVAENRATIVGKPEKKQIEESVFQVVPTSTGPLPRPSPSSTPGFQYPRGVVRKTWAFGYAREEDIKIEEVLQKDDLNIAVLSAFQWDVEWLLHKLDLNKTKIIFVMQAKDEDTVCVSSKKLAD